MHRPSDVPVGELTPPGPAGRIVYLLGGTLGPDHHEWVRRDLIHHGWRRRQVLRMLTPFLVAAIAFALLPGAISVRLQTAAILVIAGLVMATTTSGRYRNKRLLSHDFEVPPPPKNAEDEYLDALEAQEASEAASEPRRSDGAGEPPL